MSLADEKLTSIETLSFREFVRLVVDGDPGKVSLRLSADPKLATMVLPRGATRQDSTDYFFTDISHYIYAGDTALHMAAAAFSRPMAELLVSYGADCRARNRRGAEPLHYASDGRSEPPDKQADVIAHLITIGADVNTVDNSGVSPLHRAVRRRSSIAVQALLEGGAKPRQPNKSGSTPLHLAVQTTGASGSGSDEAREQQAAIIRLLLSHGANPADRDAKGKTVEEAATSDWIRKLLYEPNKG